MNARAVIAVVALGVAAICGYAFVQVVARITLEVHEGKRAHAPVRSAGWHLLHTPTRILLREYRIARPDGTLVRYMYALYITGGAAAVVFFADVLSFLRR
jgi:hypothetical protein